MDNVSAQKLWAILVLEADFNALHKIMFNNRLILTLEEMEAMPMEAIGRRRLQAATHLALNRKLIADTSNERKLLTVTICTHATNCYNRVAYPFASLCAQYFRLEILHLAVLFRTM